MKKQFHVKTRPVARPEAVVQGEKYRITVLTPWLLRLEYNENGLFEDRPTQCVWNRRFPVPEFQVQEEEHLLRITTEGVQLTYDREAFSANGLSIKVRGNISAYNSIWRYGEKFHDLRGTARTLDEADGAVPLGHGVISRDGFSVLDDSHSLLLREDGWVEPRTEEEVDIYFFGYGHQYEKCLQDFYRLTGNTPLLPRYALGNWWSRYHRYTEEEYKELMLRFKREQIPFSVAVIDMDWHLVDIDPKYGSGWTGYTWNRELFPDPAEFMAWLHRENLRVTLNVHPADGVRPHEEAYREMAEALGRDWENEEFIDFDITDQKFLDACFRYLYHPQEEQGVDFWWIDWQQGVQTKVPGLDPLWMLNHYHYLDSARDGKRGMTFSRYAGIGSHRYPVGFSGDTIITWESLDFQPYFTANASNAGYGWWSHDIGGHMRGYRDDELSVRWLQFGVFSPINRLHSTNSPFNGKEPWNYNIAACEVMKRYLRLRHALIPYLYTMNCDACFEGRPLVRPMYYREPERQEAYEVPNEYYFGTEMIVCPITCPGDKASKMAGVVAWLPEGQWFDLFRPIVYDGGRKLTLYRGLEDIPVLVKAGGILPMADQGGSDNRVENPAALRVRIYPGADGHFVLKEDNDRGEDRRAALTRMEWNWTNRTFTIHKPEGDLSVLPADRRFTLEFTFVTEAEPLVYANGEQIKVEWQYEEETSTLKVLLPELPTDRKLEISFASSLQQAKYRWQAEFFRRLYQAEMLYEDKERLYRSTEQGISRMAMLGILGTMKLDGTIRACLQETLLAENK